MGVTGITAPSLEHPGQAFQSIWTLHPASVFTGAIAQLVKGVFATFVSALFLSTSVPASLTGGRGHLADTPSL